MDEKLSRQLSLVDALLKCPTLANRSGRDQCVKLLNDPIPTKVERYNDAHDDLMEIVRTCSDHEDGLDSLLQASEAREQGSVHMQRVRECVSALTQILNSSDRVHRITPAEVKPLDGACALVIGISKYQQDSYTLPNGKKTLPFPNLDFPAEDAKEIHKYLKDCGCNMPDPLLDENATLQAIKRAIDDLCKQSKTSDNPVVLIFFSGHGARDLETRHYLVPYDGMRNDLFATALWSETFRSFLRQMPESRRVIVFVDACHAAWTGESGVKGLQGCDPVSLVDEGMYVIASSQAEQPSLEADGHGIFSQELLRLLRFEDEDDGKEELELFGLYSTLEHRVLTATKTNQKPWSNLQKPTGIILAVNQALREKKQSWEQDLLHVTYERLKAIGTAGASEMRACLKKFIIKGKVDKGRDEFCSYFRDVALRLKGAPPSDEIDSICESLILIWKQWDISSPKRNTLGVRGYGPLVAESKEATVSAAKAPVSAAPNHPVGDKFVPTLSRSIPEQVGGLPTSSSVQPQGERCKLRDDDVKEILNIIWSPLYGVARSRLFKLLSKPDGISIEEYNTWSLEAKPRGDEAEWERVLGDIGERFITAWQLAKDKKEKEDNTRPKPTSLLSVRVIS